MEDVKRSLLISGLGCALTLSAAPVYAVTASPDPTPSINNSATPQSPQSFAPDRKPNPHPNRPTPSSSQSAPSSSVQQGRKAARDAARAAYQAALMAAQNGRDLAFADANATLMQSLQTAGKDKAARQAARDAYKAAATGIINIYRQAIATAQQNYKAALAAIGGK